MKRNRAMIWVTLSTIIGPVIGYWLMIGGTPWEAWPWLVQLSSYLATLLTIWGVSVLALIGLALLAFTFRQIIKMLRKPHVGD